VALTLPILLPMGSSRPVWSISMRSPALGALILAALVTLGDAVDAQAPSAQDAASGASAVAGPFAIGTPVRDRLGEVIGRITRLATGRDGRSLAMVRKGSESFAVPVSRLRMQGDAAVSDLTKAELKAEGERAQD
jgi:hypothetical protein